MSKKDRYIIIMDSSSVGATNAAQMMVKQINEKIMDGYVPHGGLIVTADQEGSPSFFQAMIYKGAGEGTAKPSPAKSGDKSS
ncbi:MAG: hypothetical protein BWK79_05005 [Beggiatoa sp. IS2]|nr:MAG: hypothetical protein BWK79_05005 [Beggiatoa sp. IS2]